jgi:hypothetical protein
MHLAYQILVLCFAFLTEKLYNKFEKIHTETTEATSTTLYNTSVIKMEEFNEETGLNEIKSLQPFKNSVQLKRSIESAKKLVSKSMKLLLNEALNNTLNVTILNNIINLIDNETLFLDQLYVKKIGFLNILEKIKFYYYKYVIKENIKDIKSTYSDIIKHHCDEVRGDKFIIDNLLDKLHTQLNKLIDKIEIVLTLN